MSSTSAPRERSFAQVDVFSAEPFRGNPVAVVVDAEGLDDAAMQRIARWTNLSETTFVLPPTPAGDGAGADYRLRIWTPGGELPFAGHPTLGSASAWLDAGGRPADPALIRQETAAGIISIRREAGPDGETLAFAAPPTTRSGPLDEETLARLTSGLGLEPEQVIAHQWADNGPGWAALRLRTAAEVLAVRPDLGAIAGDMVGLIGEQPAGSGTRFEVRAFGPAAGVAEDPVTGSLNASLGQWLLREGAVDGPYRARQGTAIGRAGVVDIVPEGGELWIGGVTTVVIRGTVLA